MEKENKREAKQLENSLYRERFQFILQINDNIICQRFFRVNGFVIEALDSLELKEVMDEAVRMIQDDLVSKSRVYNWYTSLSPLKLTGFVKDMGKYNEAERFTIMAPGKEGCVACSNGDVVEKTYFNAEPKEDDPYVDNERPADGEFVFKFSFLFDDKVLYERIWDGNVYPKYVRNSVDLTNSDVMYRDRDPMSLHFNIAIIRHMTIDKLDLVYHIIKKICYILSTSFTEDKNEYTKKMVYGNEEEGNKSVVEHPVKVEVVDHTETEKKDYTYYCSTYNRGYVNAWRSATEQKTRDYMLSLYPSPRQIEYIDKYL